MKTIIACLGLMLAVGCSGLPQDGSTPRPMVDVAFVQDKGITVNADNVRFEDLVHAVFSKMDQLEKRNGIPTASMSPALANRKVSIHLQNEMSRKKLFAALEAAGKCTMVVSEDGNHATFKEE